MDFEQTKPFLPQQNSSGERAFPRERHGEEICKKIIREMGLKVTSQRLAILEALHCGRTHMTAQEVFEKVSQKEAEIGFATVYRFLHKLTECKFVTEVRMGGLPARYEITPQHHHDHLTCTKCGIICEFENTEIESLQERVAMSFGFQLTGHVLELYGVCPACKNKDTAHVTQSSEKHSN